jgi:hypothetical protein
MPTATKNDQAGSQARKQTESKKQETIVEVEYERWNQWPVYWNAVWVGGLSALAAIVVFGLVGISLGAHLVDPEHRVVSLKTIGFGTLAFSIFSSFLAFVIGGWVAGKVAGILRSEPAMLHGAVVWLTTLPLLIALTVLGASQYLGAWHGGLGGSPAWAPQDSLPFSAPATPIAGATEEELAQYREAQAAYQAKVEQWRADTPKVVRNTALGTVTALLLGLVGSVIGGWMASGEPMTLTYYRTRPARSTTLSPEA